MDLFGWLRATKARWRTQRWVRVAAVTQPRPLAGVGLHAILSTWNEADMIGVTVRNALEQGCDAVHLIDNGSDDDTVRVAVDAGARLAGVFHTERYDGTDNARRIADLIEQVSQEVGEAHLWWLILDADELVEGADGATVRQVVDGLDRSIRVVGSCTVNHYPRADHPMVAGEDPRRFPTNAQERRGEACREWHWKHPLVRWDAAGPRVRPQLGAHVVDAPRRLREAPAGLVSHHYPYRNPEVTRRRLRLLSARLHGDRWAMGRRAANADAVYREAYDAVDPHDLVGPDQVFAPAPRPPVRPAAAT